jgi:luciferase family oxidoreductase group 1
MKLSVVDQSPVPAGFTPRDALLNTIDLAQFCEALGYTRFWIAEHHATESLASPAPEIMITRVAAETSTIRVGSGAVLLPHYAALKVVEQFRVLHALYPDRIDLGLGRAPGSSGLEAYALQTEPGRKTINESDDFTHRLLELIAFMRREFREDHAFYRIKVSPDMPGWPEMWLLGSSGWSADASAQLGLPYAAAHFINPEPTRRSIEHYKANFRPSRSLSEPKALVCVGAVVADTAEEAERLASSNRLRRLLRETGERGPIPTPEEAVRRLAELSPPLTTDRSEWPRMFVGDQRQVHEQLSQMASELDIDELMLITVVHGHEARKRSYQLLAEAFEIEGNKQQATSNK